MKLKEYYYRVLKADYKLIRYEILFYVLIIGIILLVITYFLGVWRIYFVFQDRFLTGLLFTILNALTLYGQLNGIGFGHKGTSNRKIFYATVLIIVFLFISGLGFFDIIFYVNLPFLWYKYLSLSTEHGILFLLGNIALTWIIWFMSFGFERDNSKIDNKK